MYIKASFVVFYGRFLVFCLIILCGCKEARKKSAYTIGFSQCDGSGLWRKTMLDEMKMELSLHPDVNFVYADAQANSTKQISQVREMLQQGVDLLIISPNEEQPLTEVVEETYNKGIPTIIIDRKTTSSSYTAFVGADNYQIGKMAGQYIGSTLKAPVNILEIMGLPGSSPAIERDRGFTDGIKKFNNIHIKSKIITNWLKQNAEEQLWKIQGQLSSINAIFAHNDGLAAEARNVLNRLHLSKTVKVIGVDALPGTDGGLQMVAEKVINASLLYPTGGKEAILTAFRILNHESYAKENILQSMVIDSSNVDLMKMQWSRISSQQRDIERQHSLLEEQKMIYKDQITILNIVFITLVLAIVFGGLAFYSLLENRKINKSLKEKNNQILQQKNELVEMSIKAEIATEAKLNFFTNISHEFRTPLTLMLGPIEDLLHSKRTNATELNNLKLVHKNIFILMKLVNQLIDYRKIEYDNQHIKASPNNIVEFIKEIIESFKHITQKRHIDLKLVTKEQECIVWFDVNLLDKVFFNLISNSLKFVYDSGRIHIRLYQENNMVCIEIEDNGIGMTPEQAAQIFDQFYQAENGLSKGSGLGLALSKEIINLHHGNIEVKSIKWQSTIFTIHLPCGNSHLKEEEKVQQSINKSIIYEQSKNYVIELETHISHKTDAFHVLKEQSILIIEDNVDLLNYLSDKFQDHYEVFTADNGASGITEAYEHVPDLIISDVVLPNVTGKVLTERLKSDIRTSHIPIILLTAQSGIEKQIEGIKSMADAYITKPFNFDYLLANVKSLIKNRVILKEHFSSDVSTTDKLPVSKSLDKKFLNDFASIVEQNLSNEKFNVEDICNYIGVSRIQLYRKVKALLGCSITDYISNRRLKKAKYLLMNEDHTISTITYMVGFSTPNYFSTVFKSKYGCTPSEFKRKQQHS